MKNYNIAVIPGDGTGPEVIREGKKVLEAAGQKHSIKFDWDEFNWGGDNYLKTDEILPDNAEEKLKEHDAIFLGAIGNDKVKPGILEKGILLRLRFNLDQYINLRPAILYDEKFCPLKDRGPKDINFVVVRENTEGLYTGSGGFLKKGTPDEVAIQEMVSTRKGVERCIRYAFDICRERDDKKTLILCAKTNVLTYAHDLWQRTFDEVAEENKDIETDYVHVDATCMRMVKNPDWLDTIVTCNMFGDIITDLAAEIQGGLGIAAGGNLNPEGISMFEPIGGSAPKYTGQNKINPLAAIEAGRMMLGHLGEKEAAKSIEDAVRYACTQIESLSVGKMGYKTTELGDMVAEHVLSVDMPSL